LRDASLMKVMATVHPGESVFGQLAPLLESLRSSGHEVTVVTSASFAPTVAARGLTHVAAGPDWVESQVAVAYPEIMDHVHDPHGRLIDFMIDLFVRRTSDRFQADCARHLDRLEPDLVLHSFSEIGGPLAAEEVGVPHVMFLGGADNWFNRFRPVIEREHGTVDWLFRDGLVLAEPPGWSAAPLPAVDTAWLRPVAAAEPADAWSGRDRPMLHVTLGTVFNVLGRSLFKVLAAGAAPVASSVVVTVGPGLDPDRFVGLAPHVEFHRFIPLGELLSGCDGVIGHAGWGTVTACAAAGVPVAALVLGADHQANAAAVERAGFGFALRPEECTEESVRSAAERVVTDDGLHQAAQEQRDVIGSMPTADEVARFLTDRFSI
jgi:UDP:flavonoid glycosyltransferase YjiC (YdhE family)